MMHESLHAISAGFERSRLREQDRVWEEAVVEQVQRILRPQVLDQLGVNLREEQFLPIDLLHRFNKEIHHVEQHRLTLGVPPEEFYLGVLRMSVPERRRLVLDATKTRRVEHPQETS
jgi:hypothetical protein